MTEQLTCYHYRVNKVDIGEDIPHSIPQDIFDPEEVKGVPQVWFVVGEENIQGGISTTLEYIYAHKLILYEEDVIHDKRIEHWGVTTGPAIVQEVKKVKNPSFGYY